MRDAVVELARTTDSVVTTGAGTSFVARPDGEVWVGEAGSQGLAVSGSGDVKAGIIAGLLARGAEPDQAAVWADYVHGRCGERLASDFGPRGFMARDPERAERIGFHRASATGLSADGRVLHTEAGDVARNIYNETRTRWRDNGGFEGIAGGVPIVIGFLLIAVFGLAHIFLGAGIFQPYRGTYKLMFGDGTVSESDALYHWGHWARKEIASGENVIEKKA